MRRVRQDRVAGIRASRRPPVRIDPTAPARLRSEQQLGRGLLAGGVAAAAGAAAWMWTPLEPRLLYVLVAFGVGFGCGMAVREGGRGVDPVYGRAAAGLAALACVVGDLLLGEFSLFSLMFAGLAAITAHPLAFRRLTAREADAMWRYRMGFLTETVSEPEPTSETAASQPNTARREGASG